MDFWTWLPIVLTSEPVNAVYWVISLFAMVIFTCCADDERNKHHLKYSSKFYVYLTLAIIGLFCFILTSLYAWYLSI